MAAKFQFGRKSRLNLHGVHPDLILVVSRALLYSEIDFMVTEGVRDMARQKMLVDQGRSRTFRSYHLRQPDGFGHAVDVMAVGDLDGDGVVDHKDKAITWDGDLYGRIAEAVGQAAHELGLKVRWGGTFKGFFDGPHFQLED